jgi:heme-degrading monooxygenase HmoA
VPTLPWVTPHQAGPDTTHAFVMASRFEVRSLKDVPRFFWKSLSAWGQVRKAPGALGASLEARPFGRVFYTLSAWESRDALHTYARTEPHKSVMTGLRATMRDSTFTFWEVPVDGLPIDWDDAKRRLEAQARAGAPDGHGTAH